MLYSHHNFIYLLPQSSSESLDEEARARREAIQNIPLTSLHKTSHTGATFALQGRTMGTSLDILRRIMTWREEAASG